MKTKHWIIAGSGLAIIAIALSGFFLLQGKNARAVVPAQENPSAHQGHAQGAPGAGTGPENSEVTGEEEAPTIEITEDMQRMIGVRTAAATVTPLTRNIRLNGRIELNEQKLFTVNTKIEGWIEKLSVDYTGRSLKKGEPILEIYSPDLLAAQQELINIHAWNKPGEPGTTDNMIASDLGRLAEAARKRLRLWDISEEQIRGIERTGTPMRTLTISSPVSGYVAKRYAVRGMRVMAGEPLLDIADLSEVWVIAEVSEADAGLVRKGQEVSITISGLAERSFSSRIDYVYPSMSPETRTLKVRSTLKNTGDVLKPAMFATIDLKIDLGSRLVVPREAVVDTGERQIVYVDRGEGLFEPRMVTAGVQAGNHREIISGLKAGERVAATALFLIDSEAQLKGVSPAAEKASQAPAHNH